MTKPTNIPGGNTIPLDGHHVIGPEPKPEAPTDLTGSIEAALTRWQEQRRQLELQIVATNTVIAELTALLHPEPEPAPEPNATPPGTI